MLIFVHGLKEAQVIRQLLANLSRAVEEILELLLDGALFLAAIRAHGFVLADGIAHGLPLFHVLV